MNNKKITYIFYAILVCVLVSAVVVTLAVTGKEQDETTGSASTTSAPETTLPVTTVKINTTAEPVTTVEPVTVVEPVSTTEPDTTVEPETSVEPETTTRPETTEAPETTSEPGTTEPETTMAPETTNKPQTTKNPETTNSPETTTSTETTNSPETTSEPEETTTPETTKPTTPGEYSYSVTISFAGDTQLADQHDETNKRFENMWNTQTPAYFLEKVKPIFEADDFTLVNLECVISDLNLTRVTKDTSTYKQYWYKGASAYLQALTAGSVEGVSLANNHNGDYKDAGRADTLKNVKSAGLVAGTYDDTIYITKNNFTVAIICDGLWNSGQAGTILKRLKDAQTKSDYQIVYWHGGTEYRHAPLDWQIEASHKFVDAGADLVIGNHAHVLQPVEYYNGVRIVYSLGNFCYGGMKTPENATIIYQVKINVDEKGVYIDEDENIIPCYVYTGSINNFQPTPMTDETAISKLMDFLSGDLTDLVAANKRKPY